MTKTETTTPEEMMDIVLRDPQTPRLIDLLRRVHAMRVIDPSLMAELQNALVAETQARLGYPAGPQ